MPCLRHEPISVPGCRGCAAISSWRADKKFEHQRSLEEEKRQREQEWAEGELGRTLKDLRAQGAAKEAAKKARKERARADAAQEREARSVAREEEEARSALGVKRSTLLRMVKSSWPEKKRNRLGRRLRFGLSLLAGKLSRSIIGLSISRGWGDTVRPPSRRPLGQG